MRFLIPVWGLLSAGIRKECFTEEKHKQETDLKPSIITTRALRETQFVHANVFSFSSPTSLKAALQLGIIHQLCHLYGFSPRQYSCTNQMLKSVPPGEFNTSTFNQNHLLQSCDRKIFKHQEKRGQFCMEFMHMAYLSVPWFCFEHRHLIPTGSDSNLPPLPWWPLQGVFLPLPSECWDTTQLCDLDKEPAVMNRKWMDGLRQLMVSNNVLSKSSKTALVRLYFNLAVL